MTEQRKDQDVRSRNGNKREIRRVLAVLFALGLGLGSVCAAAEDFDGTKAQSELSVQAEEEYSIVSENTAGETSEDPDDMPVLFVDEEFSDEDVEIVPEAENEEPLGGTEEAAPEISVEVIQTSDGEAYDGSEIPESGTEEPGNDMAEAGLPEGEMSGECGAQPGTVYWSLDEAGVLTIAGNGPMADWESVEQTPWYAHLEDLREIVLAEGVTSVGAHAFCGAQTVEAVELAQSIECVGAFAFCRCGGFGSVTIG